MMQTADKFVVRLPEGLRDEIKEAAQANDRSMNSEIVHRLTGGTGGSQALRDKFAGQALAGEFAAQNEICGEITNNTPDEWMLDRAKALYRMADAMLIARRGGA